MITLHNGYNTVADAEIDPSVTDEGIVDTAGKEPITLVSDYQDIVLLWLTLEKAEKYIFCLMLQGGSK